MGNSDEYRIKQVEMNKYFKLPNPGIGSYFGHVREGNSEEYRTPFFRGKSLGQVCEMWEKELSAIEDVWPSLYAFEQDLRSKVGPLSIQKPLSERMEDILSYYTLGQGVGAIPISEQAIDRVVKEFGKHGLCGLRSQVSTVDKMRKSTNSGNPYFTKRKLVVNDTLPVLLVGSESIQSLSGQVWPAVAVLGWRGQEGGPTEDDVKQRVIWMFPFGVNVSELTYYQPSIEHMQKFNLVPAWNGIDYVDRHITRMFDTKGPNDLVICTDFSKFDQHFNPILQDAAKEIISRLMVGGSQSQQWLRETFPIKYNIPLMIDYGKLITGRHGMGSGSGGTNYDETVVHRALQYEAAEKAKSILNPFSQCLGDDGVLTFPGCTEDNVMEVYVKHGLEMNPDKQYSSTQDCTYLRRWHHVNYRVNGVCVGVYSTFRALGRLCEQERFYSPEIWSRKMVALRQLSILENCKYHPLKEQFVQFCMKGDKFRLGLDIPGFLDNLDTLVQEANELMPDFLGYTRSLEYNRDVDAASMGINTWWIVQYLRSLS